MANRFFSTFAVAAIISLALPDVSDAFSSRRGMRVNPVDATVFEVIPRGASGGSDFWCAAGDYAHRALGAAWTAPLYIARGRGPSVTTGRRTAVQFTLDPTAAGITPVESSLSLNALNVGESMSVQRAFTFCNTFPGRF